MNDTMTTPIGARPETPGEPWYETAYRNRRIDTVDVLAERMAALSAAYDWRADVEAKKAATK